MNYRLKYHSLIMRLLDHQSRYLGTAEWWYWWNHYVKLERLIWLKQRGRHYDLKG